MSASWTANVDFRHSVLAAQVSGLWHALGRRAAPDTAFAGSLARLGPLCLQRIDSSRERSASRAMPAAYHPLGVDLAPGWRVSYLLLSPRCAHIA